MDKSFDYMFNDEGLDLTFENVLFTRPRYADLAALDDVKLKALRYLFYDLANGICNPRFNTEACCFDGGDCLQEFHCASCEHDMTRNFADGICDDKYNSR